MDSKIGGGIVVGRDYHGICKYQKYSQQYLLLQIALNSRHVCYYYEALNKAAKFPMDPIQPNNSILSGHLRVKSESFHACV
jgi:hypothetical protein